MDRNILGTFLASLGTRDNRESGPVHDAADEIAEGWILARCSRPETALVEVEVLGPARAE
jgi:hypothetical protein